MLGIEGKQLIELQKISRNTQSETDQFFINNLEKATKQNQKDKTEIDEISKESIEIISKVLLAHFRYMSASVVRQPLDQAVKNK